MGEVEKNRHQNESYEFQPKDTVLTMRISTALLEKVKEQANHKNMDYQKFIRMILEKNINKTEEV